MDGIEVPKLQKKRPRYYSTRELELIFEKANERYEPIFRFLFHTGLRSGELVNLRWEDYLEEEKRLLIRPQEGNKTKREESIPLSEDAIKIILERISLNENDEYIFCNQMSNKLDTDNIYKHLWTILKNENIKNACVHTFRHSFASHLVIKNVPIYTVKELMRHASVKETEIYAHLANQNMADAVEMLCSSSSNPPPEETEMKLISFG